MILRSPDKAYSPVGVIEVDGQPWAIHCGLVFCEICQGCMACSEEEDCLGGDDHEWPFGWQELARRVQ